MKKYAKYFVLMIIGIIILTGCSKKVDKDKLYTVEEAVRIMILTKQVLVYID